MGGNGSWKSDRVIVAECLLAAISMELLYLFELGVFPILRLYSGSLIHLGAYLAH